MLKKISFVLILLLILGCSEVKFSQQASLVSEQFLQNGTPGKLDILLVIDNSKSMRVAQEKMAVKMGSFIDQLSKVDWQLAITTTDISNGRYGLKGEFLPFDDTGLRILTNKTSSRNKKFLNTIVREESIKKCKHSKDCPSLDEKGLEAMYLTLEKSKSKTKSLFREGADVTAILLSNEDEGSDGKDSGLVTPEIFLEKFKETFPHKSFQFHSLIVLPGDKNCRKEQTRGLAKAHYGEYAFRLTEKTNGLARSICSKDFAKELIDIGKKPRNPVKVFTLFKEPHLPSVRVSIRPRFDTKYAIDGKKILFEKAPPLNSIIDISYIPAEDFIPPSEDE